MFLDLAVVAGLASLGFCVTYGSIKHVPQLEWDFIIVGGGTAGSVLASRLTENPKFNVLVIEAGPTNENATESIVPGLGLAHLAMSRFDWNFTTVPQKGLNNRAVTLQRGFILGGTSSVNGMVYSRGPSSDYDRFARVTGDSGWSWDALQKYIKKNEKFELPSDNHDIKDEFDPAVHSFSGKVAVTLPGFLSPAIDSATIQASNELGGDFAFNLDMNSGKPLGLGWTQSTIGHDGTRSSSATSYLDSQTRSRKNLYIVTNTRVTRLLKTPGTKELTIRMVEIRSPDPSDPFTIFTASKEVILSGGAIGTPHILLHSGIGDENDLKALNVSTILHNPSVGRNLSDHPFLPITFGIAPGSIDLGPWVNLQTDPALAAEALDIWNKNGTGPYVQEMPNDHITWARLSKDSPTLALGDPSSGPNAPHIELIFNVISGIFTTIMLFVTPVSRGSVTIGSNNPLDDPLIDPAYLTTESDLPGVREGIRKALNFSKAPVWKNVITGFVGPLANATTDAEIDDVIRNGVESGLHPVGTAAMSSRDASWGVVNPDLLVKKVSGLRIVDASIMPYIPSAHAQVPVYLIAERAADMIKCTWR
ncbi:GMC oxidoreductase [Macrolepiota fuliginosa MF-IS2]|uniref:pyranose dehydrogenase (acceptor) n=1 Tax=Macrolepiota fuliginosa MF-IS2 TaxID=1400762 RepID=A0A9P5X8S5_9AGAR|nr:GMC oxidoreductase [Macrolepiota fuliginosa MF-IS2]